MVRTGAERLNELKDKFLVESCRFAPVLTRVDLVSSESDLNSSLINSSDDVPSKPRFL